MLLYARLLTEAYWSLGHELKCVGGPVCAAR